MAARTKQRADGRYQATLRMVTAFDPGTLRPARKTNDVVEKKAIHDTCHIASNCDSFPATLVRYGKRDRQRRQYGSIRFNTSSCFSEACAKNEPHTSDDGDKKDRLLSAQPILPKQDREALGRRLRHNKEEHDDDKHVHHDEDEQDNDDKQTWAKEEEEEDDQKKPADKNNNEETKLRRQKQINNSARPTGGRSATSTRTTIKTTTTAAIITKTTSRRRHTVKNDDGIANDIALSNRDETPTEGDENDEWVVKPMDRCDERDDALTGASDSSDNDDDDDDEYTEHSSTTRERRKAKQRHVGSRRGSAFEAAQRTGKSTAARRFSTAVRVKRARSHEQSQAQSQHDDDETWSGEIAIDQNALAKVVASAQGDSQLLWTMDPTCALRMATVDEARPVVSKWWGWPIRGLPMVRGGLASTPPRLYSHQIMAVRWMARREMLDPQKNHGLRGGIVSMDMGMGKTLVALAHALLSPRGAYPTLVVCGRSLVSEWLSAVSKFFGAHVRVLCLHPHRMPHGMRSLDAVRRRTLDAYDLVVTTYEMCVSACRSGRHDERVLVRGRNVVACTQAQADRPRLTGKEVLYGTPWERVICDESQRIRSQSTLCFRAMMAIGGRFRWCLSATPIHNRVDDLFAQLRFTGYAPSDVAQQRLTYQQLFHSHGLSQAVLSVSHETIGDSRHMPDLVSDLDLAIASQAPSMKPMPPMRETIVYCNMSRREREAYTIVLDSAIHALHDVMDGRSLYGGLFALFTLLRQVACAPHLILYGTGRREQYTQALQEIFGFAGDALRHNAPSDSRSQWSWLVTKDDRKEHGQDDEGHSVASRPNPAKRHNNIDHGSRRHASADDVGSANGSIVDRDRVHRNHDDARPFAKRDGPRATACADDKHHNPHRDRQTQHQQQQPGQQPGQQHHEKHRNEHQQQLGHCQQEQQGPPHEQQGPPPHEQQDPPPHEQQGPPQEEQEKQTLESLPDELVMHVLRACSARDLVSVAQASKRLASVALDRSGPLVDLIERRIRSGYEFSDRHLNHMSVGEWCMQRCSCAGMLSAKIRAVLRILLSIPQDENVVVFSCFSKCLDLLADAMVRFARRIPFAVLDGNVQPDERARVVHQFQNADASRRSLRVLMFTYAVGCEGLTLTKACHVIRMEPWWNDSVTSQAACRVYRIGQTRPVTIYDVISKGTIDECIMAISREKSAHASVYTLRRRHASNTSDNRDKARLGLSVLKRILTDDAD